MSGARQRPRRAGMPTALAVVLSVAFMVGAFGVATFVYRRTFEGQATAEEEAPAAEAVPVAAESEQVSYAGVDDPWLGSSFTTGNATLDQEVKSFCDANSVEGSTASENAYQAFLKVVWSAFEAREADEQPAGPDWEANAARHFFETGSPETGEGGTGDNYERAAAIMYCLRYFGFSDAFCVPIASASYADYDAPSAIVLTSNAYGLPCVCDPAYAADGWMLDRDLYNITVENIGQDLTQAQALGLKIRERESVDVSVDATGDAAAV